MDLDKEREEFESYEHSKKPCAYKDQLFARFEASDLDVDEHKYIGEYFNSAMQEKCELWQAAKEFYSKQQNVVPDGFKVVPINYECAWCGCTELDGWVDETEIKP